MTKTNPTYGKLTATLIGAWFILSLAASALHVFETDPSRPPIPLGVAALSPIVLFLLWFAASDSFRQFALALDPRTLTFLQAWRIAGLAFLRCTPTEFCQAYSRCPQVGATSPSEPPRPWLR